MVVNGGTTTSTIVNGGVVQLRSGGSTSNTTLISNGYENVSVGGVAVSTIVSGGDLTVSFYGGSIDTVLDGGYENLSFGTSISTTVNAGSQVVWADGSAFATAVNSGGTEYVNASGTTSDATVNFSGTEFLYSGGNATSTTLDGGSMAVTDSAEAFDTTVNSGGVLTADFFAVSFTYRPLTVLDSTVVNSGGFLILTGNTIDSAPGAITLNSGGTEVLAFPDATATVTMNVGASIDLQYISYTSGGSASVNSSGVLTVSVGGQTYVQQLDGNYADVRFQLTEDALNGTLVTAEARCFRSLTRILTDRSEAAVEDLRIGDLVQTVLGGTLTPITWIGRRHIDCARHPHPQKVWPVRVAAGAFGPGSPHTDLFLSPDHAIYVNEVLIPVKHLINGSSIAQVPVDRVTYHHIELAQHDVLLADGLPAESFLDLRDGANYANRPGPTRLYPDYSARMWEAFGCARLIVTGPELDAAQALVARFATDQAAA